MVWCDVLANNDTTTQKKLVGFLGEDKLITSTKINPHELSAKYFHLR